jgi:hypothetical protein
MPPPGMENILEFRTETHSLGFFRPRTGKRIGDFFEKICRHSTAFPLLIFYLEILLPISNPGPDYLRLGPVSYPYPFIKIP